MVDASHYFYLVLQGLFALVSRKLFLLRKCLNGHHFSVHQALSKVYSGKRSLSYLFFGLKKFMEISLVNLLGQEKHPLLEYSRVVMVKLYRIICGAALEAYPKRHPWGLIIGPFLPEHLELKIEANRTVAIDFVSLSILPTIGGRYLRDDQIIG